MNRDGSVAPRIESRAAPRGALRALITRIVRGVAGGGKYHVRVVFSDGSTCDSTRLGDPDVTIVMRSRRAEWRMALGGMHEFLAAWFDGDIDLVGEQAVRRLIHLGYRVAYGRLEHPWTWVRRRVLEWRQDNTDRAQARRNATFHYGLPTGFFHLLLGDTLGYSEGLWRPDTRSLDEAQRDNFALICQRLRLSPGDRLVEVGPGWGELAMMAAQAHGADVTCYGLVASQNDAMRERMRQRGFEGRLAIVEKDLRELADEPGRYDRFVSVGVHEHAGRHCNEDWIRSIAIALRPGGVGLISSTFNMSLRPTNYSTIRYIFPGGCIPSLAQTLLAMEKHGLNVLSIDNRSHHYHRTVEAWLENLERHWDRIRALDPIRFDERFRRTWLFYLAGAAETFEATREVINCFHVTFVKGHFAREE